ncbi:MAG: PAS domain-containing protein [Bacteroidetes bacterium]|nr:PAS domain-containing protein [Bacteroidota bacterium]MCH8523751.1 PAS domain-containing protein [Balneolales bacterium]
MGNSSTGLHGSDQSTNFDKLGANIPGVLYQFQLMKDGTFVFPYVSEGIHEMFGATTEQVRENAMEVFSLIHPDDIAHVNALIQNSVRDLSLWECDFRVNLEGKGLRWISGKARPEALDDGSILWHGYIYDITDRKEASAIFQAERTRLDNTIEAANLGTWELITKTNELVINENWAAMLGYRLEELVPFTLEKFLELLHPDDTQAFLEAAEQHMKGHTDIYEIQFRLRSKENTWTWIQSRGKVLSRDKDGNAMSMYGTHIDITGQKKAELELEKNKNLMDLFFAQSLTGFFFMMLDEPLDWANSTDKQALVDYAIENQRITRVNQAMLDQYGATEEQLLNAKILDLFNNNLEHARNVWYELFDKGTLHIETRENKLDGTPITIEGDYICLYDQKGRITGLFGVQHDVTRQKELLRKIEESEHYHRSLKNSIPDMFLVTDYDGKYLDFKADGVNLYANPKEFLGKSYREIMPPELVKQFDKTFARAIETGEVQELEYDLEVAGERKYYQARAVTFGGNKIINFVRDITPLKRYEAELKEERARAEQANQAKSRFLANMSHEIRTPLNGVIGFTDLLRRTKLDGTQQRYVENANTAGVALLEIINNILDVSKIEAGKLELELGMHDLVKICEQAVEIVNYQATEKGLSLNLSIHPDVPRFAEIDAARIRQILLNLLGNAIKFTEKGEVKLHVTFQQGTSPDTGLFQISVNDTGIGISEDQRTRLFKAFSQADASISRRYGGTGLGLLISDMLVRKMGSAIELDSKVGEGSTFSFSLQTRIERGEAVSSDQSDTQTTTLNDGSAVVLIAEDIEMNMLLTKTLVKQILAGVETIEARNGMEVLDILRTREVDLILMDVQMPGMDGLLATRGVREMEQGSGRRVPIVALTAGALNEERERCIDAGMDDFLSKPIELKSLSAKLKKYL